MSISTYEALRPALDAIGCRLRSYPIAVGGFQTAIDANIGLGVILDVPVSLSPDVGDILVDFVVIPCTHPLLLGAPFTETYGACFYWDSHIMELYLHPYSESSPWTVESPRLTLEFFVDSWTLAGPTKAVAAGR
jgi:hypothetical protein